MNRFHIGTLPEQGAVVSLNSKQTHHLFHVLRVSSGEAIELFDGKGHTARAEVIDISPDGGRVRILSLQTDAAISRIVLAFGYSKGQAFDFIIRKATEIGVAAFQPLMTQHSLHIKEWNETRWSRVIAEVAKQCQENFLPELRKPQSLDSWLAGRDKDHALIFCHEAIRNARYEIPADGTGYDLLVGAEGGWSSAETEHLLSQGAILMGLGKNRLRAETAALVGLTLLKNKIGEIL